MQFRAIHVVKHTSIIKFLKHAFTLNEEKPKKSSLNEMEVELKGGDR